METDEIMTESNEDLLSKISKISTQLDEVENKYIRIYADFDNYKKRVIKEKEDIILNTKIDMLTSILDMDNDISIAINNIKDEKAKDGVKLISHKLDVFLKSKGIESIQTNIYDKDLHEVTSVVNIGEDKIINVVSKGYSLNGKPFRFPKIILGISEGNRK